MRTIHRDIVGTFLFSNDGYILLGKSRKGGVYSDAWLVPGGGIEEGETKEQAAIRETLEEVGIDIAPFHLDLMQQVATGSSEKVLRDTGENVMVDMTFYNFVVSIDEPHTQIDFNCQDDIVEAAWHSLTDLSQLYLSPPTKEALATLGYD
jgi:8-oxo-dGTP pyrophosphatase MutT (NUDIX family)